MVLFCTNGLSKSSGIYVIFNSHNWRIYVGSTKGFWKRWNDGHYKSLLKGKHQNRFLQADFNKCLATLGDDSFLEFYVIENMPESTREERLDVEDRWIKIHFDKGKQCYNLCDRAISREGSGSKNPQETSRKISLARSGAKHHQFGKPLTKEWKQKLSNSKIGRIHSPETKAKMISAKQNARKPRISMPVKQISDTGEVLGMFDSLTQAAKAVHGQIGPISLCLKGKLKTAYGFVWELSSI